MRASRGTRASCSVLLVVWTLRSVSGGDRYSSLFKLKYTKAGFVTELLAALTVRYPGVPIHFAETRPLAEEWTYRFLGAALAYHQAEQTPSPST